MNVLVTRKHVFVSTMMLAVAWLPAAANACSCPRNSLKELYGKSTQVFIAEVVKVKRARSKAMHEDAVVNKAVLKPKRMFKGRNPGSFTIKYEVMDSPVFVDGVETVIVGGCYLEMEEGDEYVVMTSPGESLDWPDWCTTRFLDSSRIELDYLESLAR